MINKFLERIARGCRFLMSYDYKSSHKYQNKNQITNSDLILYLLKQKNIYPKYIVDVGCGYGEWTLKMLKYFPKSNFVLFDANNKNETYLSKLKANKKNINYNICLLSDDEENYDFYNMGTGSSIYEEQTSHNRKIEKIKSTTLFKQLPSQIHDNFNNLIKLDVQGAELKILNGLNDLINSFEIIILEVSLHQYNKNAPLFNEVVNFMDSKGFKLYDLLDFKRLGNTNSFLLQFDCVFVKKNSYLFDVKFQ